MIEDKFWFTVQVIALFCAYLIITIPAVSAVSIRAFMPGSDMPQTFSFTPADKIERRFGVSEMEGRYDEIWVNASVVGKDPEYIVKNIYLFMCGNADAGSCSEEEPIEAVNYLSGERKTFKWTGDLAVGKIANFMTLVQLEYKGRGMWVGFWDQLERTDVDVFEHRSSEIDVLDVYLKDDVDADWVKYYVQNYFMIPSDWMERAVITTIGDESPENTERLLGDGDDLDSHHFLLKTSDTTVLPSDHTYMFVFGKDIMSSPITFFSQPATSCDGFECEAGLGENPETCCLDCGCRQVNQECDTSTEYPNGLCHVCGDGTHDSVENYNNCCADAGCPEGLSCDTSRNVPYGTCVPPDCGNGICDEPVENASSCCIDCGGTDACKATLGSSFYCNTDLVRCVEPVCGERGCEPGEDETNCCLDCGGCPAGEYCNASLSENGVCVSPGCGSNGCEPGEDSDDCCIDCGCPLDAYTGFEQTCTQNVCHLCGNGNLESVENEENCCLDSNCERGYCADDYSCRDTDELGINVFIEPEGVDCRQEGDIIKPIKVTITLENRTHHFSYFDSAVYSAYGKTKSLRNCMLNGEAYECEIPLDGTDIYVGCFEGTGIQQVTVSTMVGYYNDSEDYESRDITETFLSETVNITVEKSRERVCNRKNDCEPELGEDHNYCCHDCGCPYGFVCLNNTCSTENDIELEVDESSLPDADQLVCNRGETVLDMVTFSADVIKMPHTDDDPFNLVTYGLAYDGKIYGSHNLSQFYCEPETTSDGLLTGKVNCGIPISVFPPCPYPSPQELELMLWVTGGGLSEYYSQYSGKMISDTFRVSYTQGLPRCYDGKGTCDDGENQENCCQDCGCPEGEFCSVLSGCKSEDDFTFNVWVEPEELDCSSSIGKTVKFFGEVDPKPIGSVFFKDTMLDEEDIQYSCSTGFYTKYASNYILECEIPYQNFDYCWGRYGEDEPFDFDPDFETTFSYDNGTGFSEVKFTGTASFTVETPRERGCSEDMYCDSADGEIPVQCCRGCGCAEGELCTYENKCTDKEPKLVVTSFPPTVDCSGYDEVVIKAEITDQPVWKFDYIKWNISVDGQEVDISNYCSEEYEGAINKYICELSVREIPVCRVPEDESGCTKKTVEGKTVYDCTKEMELLANVSYTEPVTFETKYVDPTDTFTMKGEDILASCGNDECDGDIGENYVNCCEDCACPDGEICTLSPLGPDEDDNCIAVDDIELTLPETKDALCYRMPSRQFDYPWPPERDVIDAVLGGEQSDDFAFECGFPKPLKLDMELKYKDHDIIPYGLDEDIGGKVEIDLPMYDYYEPEVFVDMNEMEVAFQMWNLGSPTRELIPETVDINVTLELDVIAPGGGSVVPITKENTVKLLLERKDGDKLNELEGVLKWFRGVLIGLAVLVGITALFLSYCGICPGDTTKDPNRVYKTIETGSKFLKVVELIVFTVGAGLGIFKAVTGFNDLSSIASVALGAAIGGAALGLVLGAITINYGGNQCPLGKVWGTLCSNYLLVASLLLFAIGGTLLGLECVENDYNDLKEQAGKDVGDSMENHALSPNSFD